MDVHPIKNGINRYWSIAIWQMDMIWYMPSAFDLMLVLVSVIVFAFWLCKCFSLMIYCVLPIHFTGIKNISEPLRPSLILKWWQATGGPWPCLLWDCENRELQCPKMVISSISSSCQAIILYGMIGRQYSIFETTNSPTRLPDVNRFSKNMFPLLKFLSSARCKWNSAHSISLNGLKWSTSLWIDPYPDPQQKIWIPVEWNFWLVNIMWQTITEIRFFLFFTIKLFHPVGCPYTNHYQHWRATP
jgi:hypothetical protein